MPARRPRLPAAPALAALLAFAATQCGRPHDLGVTSSPAAATGAPTGTTSSGGGAGGATSATGAGGMPAPPPGPTKLTVVNGVNDYEAVRLCFLPHPGGDPAMKPWPEAAAGLSFARAMVIDPIGATVPPGKDIRPVVLAGDLSQIAGKTCEEAIALASASSTGGGGASPAPIVAAALPVLPAPVFDSKKSILFAPIGCLGGAGHDGPGAEVACGAGYSPSTPTASLVVVGMSRVVDPGHLSLQVVNASTALEPSDVRLATGLNTGAEWPVALSVETGEIVPSPPFAMVASKDLGPLDKAAVKTYAQGQMSATSQTQLSEAAAHGTASMAELADGAGFVLIGVGAYPGAAAGAFWHEFTFTLIKADP